MSRFLKLSVAACLATLPMLAQAPAGTPAEKVGILNIQQAILASQEGKKATADLNTRFAPKQQELAGKQKSLQALQQKLQDGGNTLSAEAKAELTRNIESQQKELQFAAEQARTDFQGAENDMVNAIGNKMVKIVNDYAQKNGYAVILDVSFPWPQNPVLFASEGINITDLIVKLYDAANPVVGGASARPATPAARPKP